MRKVYLMAGEVVVQENKLKSLQRKAAAHDGYVRATQEMGAAQDIQLKARKRARETNDTQQGLYSMGWLDCLHTFDDAVVRSVAAEIEAQMDDDET